MTDTHEQTEPFESEELVRALQARERFLIGVLGSLGSLVTVDDDWRITFVNGTAERTTGMTANELLGSDLRELALAMAPQVSLAAAEKAMSREGDHRVRGGGCRTRARV